MLTIIVLNIILILVLILALILMQGVERYENELGNESVENISIAIVYDNNPYKEGLKTAWGFSCVIRCGRTILFDTGGNGTILLENMEKLGINPKDVDIVVLSHIHNDHVGGLSKFLKINHNVTVYLLRSFPEEFKEEIKGYGVKVVEVQEPLKIFDGVYSTGEMGIWIKEQSLLILTKKGIIIITGCAHPGIVEIVKRAKELLRSNVLLVMGGFHLIGQSEESIREIISYFKDLNVKYVAPCHCSGDLARKLFKEEYKERYINAGVGKVITLNNLV
jgi:7,8-dihydropterin-6-yl-methyl-4-(beta-D-ribofuranosyl)aminobenzene 5'-phosphate synthase